MTKIRLSFSWFSSSENWADTNPEGISWAELPPVFESQTQLGQQKLSCALELRMTTLNIRKHPTPSQPRATTQAIDLKLLETLTA